MKEQYKDLKLIMECPTQEAWDKVSKFFGLKWSSGSHWHVHANKTAINIFDNLFESVEYYKTFNGYPDWERLTYPEFEARFLKNMETTKEYIYEEEVRGILKELDALKQKTEAVLDAILSHHRKQPPEKWTVERVYDEVKPSNYISTVDNMIISQKYGHFECGEILKTPTVSDAKKVLAFYQLLTCAHWANEGEQPGAEQYGWYWDYNGNQYTLPVPFETESCKYKFLSIEGIEPLLKTFFGIE